MSDSDIGTRKDFTSWGLLEGRMAYGLETRIFVCWANMYNGWNLRFGGVALGRVCAQYTILYQIEMKHHKVNGSKGLLTYFIQV